MNHNTHINHVHLQALIELPIATVYNNTGLSKMYGPFLINHLCMDTVATEREH